MPLKTFPEHEQFLNGMSIKAPRCCSYSRVCVLVWHSRDADLKQVVLDELFTEHGDAELNAELHETAAVGALSIHIKHHVSNQCLHQRTHDFMFLYLLHAIGLEHIEITSGTSPESVQEHRYPHKSILI